MRVRALLQARTEREMQAKPGSHSLPGVEIKAAPLELCSEPDLVMVIDGWSCSWERAGNGEGAQSGAGSTTVEGRDRVLAPRGQGTLRAPRCDEGTGRWHAEGKEWAGMEHHGWNGSERGSQHPGCGGRQAGAPTDWVRDRQFAPVGWMKDCVQCVCLVTGTVGCPWKHPHTPVCPHVPPSLHTHISASPKPLRPHVLTFPCPRTPISLHPCVPTTSPHPPIPTSPQPDTSPQPGSLYLPGE